MIALLQTSQKTFLESAG